MGSQAELILRVITLWFLVSIFFRDGMGPFKSNKSNWLSPLKQVLTEHGFKEVWDNRGTSHEHKFLIDLKRVPNIIIIAKIGLINLT